MSFKTYVAAALMIALVGSFAVIALATLASVA